MEIVSIFQTAIIIAVMMAMPIYILCNNIFAAAAPVFFVIVTTLLIGPEIVQNQAVVNARKQVGSGQGHACGTIDRMDYSGGGFLSQSSVLVLTDQCGSVEINTPGGSNDLTEGTAVSRISIKTEFLFGMTKEDDFLCYGKDAPNCIPII